MKPIIYLLHAREDERFEEELSTHLAVHERVRKDIVVWRDREQFPGGSVRAQREKLVDEAHIVVLLVTPDFWSSCYELALRAMARSKLVIPVITRVVDWDGVEFSGFRALPRDNRAVERWPDRDSAWYDVVQGLKMVWDRVAASEAARVGPAVDPPTPPATGVAPGPLPAGTPLKILLVTANQLDQARLHLGEEVYQIRERILRGDQRERFNLIHEPEVRVDQLASSLMRHRPHIVHLSGHGTPTGAVLLADPDEPGASRPMDPLSLRQLFRVLHDNLHVVILNACYSADHVDQANALAEVAGCVIGVTGTVEDGPAIRFVSGFYEALAFSRSVQEAFDLGKVSVGSREDTRFQLHHRANVDPAALYLLRPRGDA